MNANIMSQYIQDELMFDLQQLLSNEQRAQAAEFVQHHPSVREEYKKQSSIN